MRDFWDEILPARLKARPLLKDVATTTLFAVGGRVLGFLIPFFIAFWFGASGETDVFFLVYTLIYLVSFVLGDTMGEILIPYFSDIRVKGGNAALQVGRFFVFGGVFRPFWWFFSTLWPDNFFLSWFPFLGNNSL